MDISSSKDLLFFVLSICSIWLTAFLCWLLYQAIRFLKNANEIVETVTHKLEMISDSVQFMRDKFEGVSKQMGSISGMLGGIIEKFVMSKLSSKLEDKINEKKSGRRKK